MKNENIQYPDLSVAEAKKTWEFKTKKDNSVVLQGYKGEEKSVIVPNKIGNGLVVEIGEYALSGCKIQAVYIGPSVKTIGKRAFDGCFELEEVSCCDGLELIGEEAFSRCRSLEKAFIPDSVKTIKEGAFWKAEALKEVHISSETIIEKGAFSRCPLLADSKQMVIIGHTLYEYYGDQATVNVPLGVTSIDEYAFANKSFIKKVKLPEGCTALMNGAFYNCENLSSVESEEPIKYVGVEVFFGCKKLVPPLLSDDCVIESAAFTGCKKNADAAGFVIVHNTLFDYFGKERDVVVPNGVRRISFGAFTEKEKIKSVSLPQTVENVDAGAFLGCKGLANEEGMIIINEVLYDYFGNTKYVVLPKKIRKLSYECCKNASFKSVIIPDDVLEIENSALVECEELTGITVSKNVSKIGKLTFAFCPKLTTVWLRNGDMEIEKDAFVNSPNIVLYSSKGGKVEQYAKAYKIPFEAE